MPLPSNQNAIPVSEHDQHSSFIKTPKQLITVILLAFIVPITIIVMLVTLATNRPSEDPGTLNPDAVAARIQPVARWDPSAAPAQVARAAPPAAPAAAAAPAGKAGATDGKSVYDQTCHVCHAAGVAGAPKLGDKAAWGPRISQGMNTLVQAAVKGKGAMPPKGGNAGLSDAQVRAAVEFMVSQSK
jgi:cytochrome c5